MHDLVKVRVEESRDRATAAKVANSFFSSQARDQGVARIEREKKSRILRRRRKDKVGGKKAE